MRMQTGGEELSRLAVKCLLAALTGALASLAALAVCAVGIWQGRLPEDVSGELVLGAAMLGGAAAGAAMPRGEGRAILRGLAGGACFLVLFTLTGAACSGADSFGLDWLRTAICALAGGAFGGVISTGKKNKNARSGRKGYTKSNHRKKLT